MTASEFAFLALGLVLGIASGAAIVVVLGSRSPAREVKLTVERDAVPRRAATLSSDAFVTAPNEPARGGPADRRRLDRDGVPADLPPLATDAGPGIPVMATPVRAAPLAGAPTVPPIRTSVPTAGSSGSARPAGGEASGLGTGPAAALPAVPDHDPSLDALRIQAVLAAQRAQTAGLPTATALLDPQPGTSSGTAPEPGVAEPAARPATSPRPDLAAPGRDDDSTPAIIRILRGDHRALFDAVEVVAGDDEAMRRPWQAALTALAEGIMARAIEHGVLDFPVGNPFWDTFTIGQCRAIAGALAVSGHRFDAIDGWEDGRVPNYRDLTIAVASAGLEPRRIRAWPTQDQIASLYADVTIAADEFLLERAPDLEIDELRELAGSRAPELGILWQHWEMARPVLAGPLASS